mmetsp:Transcript_59739/g.112681  ORF Transcript_59739/g.112681 Transcript_59739/m.112681 type:complete len:167 (-) Transcript_59739:8-508(-)
MSVRLSAYLPGCASVREGRYYGSFQDGEIETSFVLDIYSSRQFTLVRKSGRSPYAKQGVSVKPSLQELKFTGTALENTRKNPLKFDPHPEDADLLWTDDPPTYSKVGIGAVQIKVHVQNQKTFPEQIVRLYSTNLVSGGTWAKGFDTCLDGIYRCYKTVTGKKKGV